MRRAFGWAGLLVVAALSTAAIAGRAQEEKGSALEPPDIDRLVYGNLREVINHGADLYNSGDMSGCYRLYEGSLMTVRPLLGHRAELQKAIRDGMANARRDPVVWRRAWQLRGVLDKVRAEVRPRKETLKKLPAPREPEEKKPPETQEKEPAKKEPEKKEPEKKEPEKKESEKKPAVPPEDKGAGARKPAPPRAEDKKPDLPPPDDTGPDVKNPDKKDAE
jgi:hypothetical protein